MMNDAVLVEALRQCVAILEEQATCVRCGDSLIVDEVPYCECGCGPHDEHEAAVRFDDYERNAWKRREKALEVARKVLAGK